MAQYLVVAHRTAKSPELAAKLREVLEKDREARFVLLVPAVPPPGWVYEENEVRRRAEEEAEAAKKALEAQGLPIAEAKAGDISPLLAIEEELLAQPGAYRAIVLATLSRGFPAGSGLTCTPKRSALASP
nr:hypothetical protein [Thermus sediminis]